MGVSEASGASSEVGPVGSIVWVRRRNGSWWPGRILEPEELPASQLMPPKSGTPVKLLGREDASVEWYNLEKSIRVKQFRCAEFGACIKRAEASQGIPVKRREKYARREDAILHALDLERRQLEKHQKSGSITNNISNEMAFTAKRESSTCSLEDDTSNFETVGYNKFSGHIPQVISGMMHSSMEEDDVDEPLYVQKGRYGKTPSKEEDIPETVPRTRGLQDFGLRIAPAKKKHTEFVAWDNLQKPVANHGGDLPSAGHGMSGQRYASGGKNPMAIKRKSSHAGTLEESPGKRRDRRRPLVQVLESSAKLPSFNSFRPDYNVGSISTQGEKDNMGAICRAKRSKCIYLPANSNDSVDHVGYSHKPKETVTHTRADSYHHQRHYLVDGDTSFGLEQMASYSAERDGPEADMDEEENLLPDTRTLIPDSKNSGREARENPIVPQMHPHGLAPDVSTEAGVSKWHLKGKRNVRNLVKGPIDTVNGNNNDKCNASVDASFEVKETRFKMEGTDPSTLTALGQDLDHRKEFDYACPENDLINGDASNTQLIVYDDRRYASALKPAKDRSSSFVASDNDDHVISQAGWEVDGPSHATTRIPYWKEPLCSDRTYADNLSDEMESMIVDVDLKVQTDYHGEHVPLVSLRSKLNGKAIIGHPVQVEILEDGSSASLFSRNEPSLDESAVPSPVWKTARRTAIQRVPRSNPARSALEGEDSEPLQCSDLESNPPIKVPGGHKAKPAAKKNTSHSCRSASGRFQRKPSKSVSLSGKKTRKLSSLSTEKRHSGENGGAKIARDGDLLGGLIKPEGAVPLIPVKVAFTRILEAIGRPSSSVAHRAVASGSTGRDA